ncbi:MAG TPA: response regulator transcription factor, partial [Polyangiaceae bacterium]|nr:response regulator transcription factor [Polyangiaceae bacterium]
MRLLIVDDHPLFRVGLKAMLERQGFKVVGEASNGREAVEKALTLTIDAVLLDIKMPDMDGIEAARELRRRGFEGSIVMLTTFTEPALQVEAARAGANAF